MLNEAAACGCTLQMQPSVQPVYPRAWRPCSTCSSGRMPASRLLCLPLSGATRDPSPPSQLCRHCGGCGSHACSNCACLPVVTEKPRPCTLVVGPLTYGCCGDSSAIATSALFNSLRVCVRDWQFLTRILQASNPTPKIF